MTIDFTKPIQTRDGQPVEIKFTDGRGSFPVRGYIDSDEVLSSWTKDGEFNHKRDINSLDLINVTEKRVFKGWLTIYPNDVAYLHEDEETARNAPARDCLATVPIEIEYTVGEGLE